MEEQENSDEHKQNENEHVELVGQNINNSASVTHSQISDVEPVKDKKKVANSQQHIQY